MSTHRAVLVACVALAAPSLEAQAREPLCVTVAQRRLASASYLVANGSDRVAARPFRAVAGDGAAFAVAVRDPEQSFRVGAQRSLRRSLDELELNGAVTAPARTPGLLVLRVSTTLGVVGEGVSLPDPVPNPRTEETVPPGVPVGVTVDDGVLVIEHVGGDLYATVVPPTGPVPPVTRIAEAPPARESNHRGFVWLSATEYAAGAVALAGTDDGDVVALRFDAHGQRVGEPSRWSQRVGGAMRLLPIAAGAEPTALLERPVRGATSSGEQAREQVMVHLRPTLEPDGEPERVGLGPYETAAVVRNGRVVLTQWAEARGLAMAELPLLHGRPQVETPRIWTTLPLDGVALGHTAIVGPGQVVYDLMLHGDDVAGALHAYATFVPPAGTPYARRDVMPLRARVIAPPALLPAEDGFVAVLAVHDEVGGGLDAVHVRCDMVTLPPR